MNQNNGSGPRWLTEITKTVAILAATIVFSYKVITSPLTIDAATFISLILALFSVWLSALFYFKATDSSNAFYDNTYKFTQDIAELLARIESGFGERLRHLDEGYNKIQDRFFVPVTKDDVAQAEEQVQEKQDDREKLVEELLNRAKLQDDEKQQFLSQLAQKDAELHIAQKNLELFNEEINELRKRSRTVDDDSLYSKKIQYYLKEQFEDVVKNNRSLYSTNALVEERWKLIAKKVPKDVRDYMIKCGFINVDGYLNKSGIR